MAERITDYERVSKPGPDSPYPWDDWLEIGTEWRLVEGTDFDCTPQSITDLARRHARRMHEEGTRDIPTVSVFAEDGAVVIVND